MIFDDSAWIPDQSMMQGPLPGDDDFYGDEPWEPDGITVGLGDGEFGFYFFGTTWGYYVFGEGISVDGGTELSDGSWLVPGDVDAFMIGRDDDDDGLPDGVTFEQAGGV